MGGVGEGTSRPSSRIGMLGGTFDPPHLAHLALAKAAREQLDLDHVVFVPAGDPWRKRERDVSPVSARLAMLRAAVDAIPWARISTVEIERSGPTYSAETLASLVQPGDHWWFIIGADALADLVHWHRPEEITRLARLAVAARPGAPPPEVSAELRAAVPDIDSRIDFVTLAPMPISSTEIRRRIREGRRTDGTLPAAVRAVADSLGLYRDGGAE